MHIVQRWFAVHFLASIYTRLYFMGNWAHGFTHKMCPKPPNKCKNPNILKTSQKGLTIYHNEQEDFAQYSDVN